MRRQIAMGVLKCNTNVVTDSGGPNVGSECLATRDSGILLMVTVQCNSLGGSECTAHS